MKLVHPDYSFQIEFHEGIVQKLVLESPVVMSNFIVDFKEQLAGRDGKWVLSHEGKLLKISDKCDLIVDIFGLQINQRKMLNALYDKMSKEINDTDLLVSWEKINFDLQDVLNQAIDEIGYDIEYEDLELKNLFKGIALRFREGAEGYAEYLLEYLQMMSEVCRIQLFVIVNITSFLTKTELKYLYEQVSYKKYQLLLLDTQNVNVNNKMERTIIVDKDYCVIELSV